mmetsp:Transcript_68349/g.152561  ORF Transcript_68349/g.152561 Transcript_68349/m.152561 type:complete len:298 (-) Transcript_68349:211-1104(-)
MGCGASSSAPKGEEGKKPTKQQGSPSGLDTFDELEVKAIGVESLDGIFANSQDVCNVLFKINDAFVEAVLAIRKVMIELIKIAKGASKYIKDFVKEALEECIKVEAALIMEGKCPVTIEFEGWDKMGPIKEIVDKCKGAFEKLTEALTAITEIEGKLKEIAEQCKGYTSNPSSLIDEIKGSGLSPMKIPGAISTAKKNMSKITELPKMLTTVKGNGGKLCTEIKDACAPTVERSVEGAVKAKEMSEKDITDKPIEDESVPIISLVACLYSVDDVKGAVAKLKEEGTIEGEDKLKLKA